MSVEKNTVKKATLEERRKRVERLKKIICIIVIVCLLLPTILCVTLWVKVVKMEKKINTLVEMHTEEYQADNEKEDMAYAVETESVDKSKSDAKKKTVESSKEKKETNEVDQTKIKGKKVYLTFDDGPSDNTETVLNVLKQQKVKATFFVVGRTDEKAKALYKRIYNEGHTLAMHSYTHDYQKIYKSVDAYKKDITKLSDLLYDITGEKPKYLRFPGGSSNTVSKVDMKKVILYTKEAGLTYYDWNVINGDATGKKLSESQMVSSVVSGVKQYETSIVLMHDCAGKEKTAKTLPSIIKKLKKMKVTFLPINDTTTPIQHIKADNVK